MHYGIDLHDNVKGVNAIPPVVVTDNTATDSNIIDRQGFEAVEFFIVTGVLADADATFAVTMTEGDASNLSDGVAVTDSAFLLGTLAGASFTFAADNKVSKIGYRGTKRYVKITITPSANTGNAPIAAVAVLSGARKPPFTTQLV